MTVAWYAFRATWRQMWRITTVVAVIGGLLGAVALGAVAAARRTDSAYGRYLRSVNASQVQVDVPGPFLFAIKAIEHAPGVVSHGAWIGVAGDPVIRGKVDRSFQTNALTGDLDGEFYRLDKLTVLAGKLPPPTATDDIMLTQSQADAFRSQGVVFRVGDRMTWQLSSGTEADPIPKPTSRVTYRIAAIVSIPPALDDQFDDIKATILTPTETDQILSYPASKGFQWAFGWATLRLRDGDAGVPALRAWLASYSRELRPKLDDFPISFTIHQLSRTTQAAQQAIKPQALALAILGGLAALALLILMAQGLAQLLARPAADAPTLRALGASRAAAAAAIAGWGLVAVLGAIVLSVAGAIAVSPLAPVGPVRLYDPVRGVQADPLVLGGGAAVLLVILLVQLGWLAWRTVRQVPEQSAGPSALVNAASRAALPVTIVTGIRHALERGTGRLRAPVLATMLGSIVAVTALVAALVFGASLTGLTGHPDRYGYTWDELVQSSGGWGSWPTGHLDPAAEGFRNQHQGLLGWSELGFGQVSFDRTEIPVMGVLSHGSQVVEPPTISGHRLTGQDQIEFGSVTMRQLGLHIGQRIRLGHVRLTVVGAVTLPSFGVVLTDHPSLGSGAMTDEATLLRILGLPPNPTVQEYEAAVATPAYPATIIFDARTKADAKAIAASYIRTANSVPGNAGDYYALKPQLGAAVRNAKQMGSQPLTLAIGVAAAAILALALTIMASVRERRRDLALLKSLGMRSRQIRAIVSCQTTTTLVIAIVVGVPLGIAAGNWTWTSFANSIGVVPLPVVPTAALAAGVAALLIMGNLLALWPAQVAARVAPAATLRTE